MALHRNEYTKTYTSDIPLTKADLIAGFVLKGLDNTPFGHCDCDLGIPEAHGHCSGCGILHHTEGDFARHYLIPDATYKNLGECPERGRVGHTINIPSNLVY